ncbi:MAG: CvpA family protein [Dehalococcoidia bacterium]|nr:CvpA family protein [Dehalococcoidia bacterium]
MNWLDTLILVTLAAGVIGGLTIGIVRSLVNLVGLLFGIFLAGRCYETVGHWLVFIDNTSVANTVGFVLIVLVVMIIAGIICALLRKWMSTVFLGCLDRLLGGIVGLFIGAMSWGALLVLWVEYFNNDAVSSSLVAEFLLDKFPLVMTLLPSNFDGIKNFFGN